MSKYSSLIEEIHNEYVESTDLLVEQVATLEKEKAVLHKHEEDVKALKDIGFENFAQAKSATSVDERIEQLQNSVNDSAVYAQKYPLYKFITETNVNRINEKYNLRFGRASSFVGEIPPKNMQEIIQAERVIKKEDRVGLVTLEWQLVNASEEVLRTIDVSMDQVKALLDEEPAKTSISRLRTGMASTMGVQIPTMATTWKEHKHLNADKWILVRDKTTVVGTITTRGMTLDGPMTQAMNRLVREVGHKHLGNFVFITAPLDEFEGPSSKTVSDLEVTEQVINIIPDPIVLYEVKTTSKERGFLIASAWGDEASDPDVVNENFN